MAGEHHLRNEKENGRLAEENSGAYSPDNDNASKENKQRP